MAEQRTAQNEPNPFRLDAVGECQLHAIMRALKKLPTKEAEGNIKLEAVTKFDATNLNYAIEDRYFELVKQHAIKPTACPRR